MPMLTSLVFLPTDVFDFFSKIASSIIFEFRQLPNVEFHLFELIQDFAPPLPPFLITFD
jgi:hypothetical protein